jgi:hypothetical protein
MGYAARLNPRSIEGGKPGQSVAFARVLRGVQFWYPNRAGFDAWLDTKTLTEDQRAQLDRVWMALDSTEKSA